MSDALVWTAVIVLAVPAALLGQWIGYNGSRWLDCKLGGRPTDAEVARRLMQVEIDRLHDRELRRSADRMP